MATSCLGCRRRLHDSLVGFLRWQQKSPGQMGNKDHLSGRYSTLHLYSSEKHSSLRERKEAKENILAGNQQLPASIFSFASFLSLIFSLTSNQASDALPG